MAFKKKGIDLSTVIGISVSFFLVMLAIVLGSKSAGGEIDLNTVAKFFDLRSVLIVVAGTFMVTCSCFSFKEIIPVQKLILKTVFYRKENLKDSATACLEMAYIARTKCSSFLELEKYRNNWNHNQHFERGMTLLIDNVDPESVKNILQHELVFMNQRHQYGISIFRKSAEIAPAMGLIGTLVGLVQMLGQLNDPSTIGPSMAIALLTTFYGAILAYMVFIPLASKLERNTKDEINTAKLYIATVDSIAMKDNPRNLQDELNGMLSQTERVQFFQSKQQPAS